MSEEHIDDLYAQVIRETVEVERSFLSTLLSFPEQLEKYRARIQSKHFYPNDPPYHGVLYEIMLKLQQNGMEVNPVNILQVAKDFHVDDYIDYELIQFIRGAQANPNSLDYYADKIITAFQARELNDLAHDMVKGLATPTPQIGEIVSKSQERLEEVLGAKRDFNINDITAQGVFKTTITELFERQKHGRKPGLPTDIPQLDDKTHGLKPGELIIIAGRPASGKSTFAMNIAEHNGYKRKYHKPIVVFTLEMPATQVMLRSIANLADVPQNLLTSGKLDNAHISNIKKSAGIVIDSKVYIDDSSYGLTVEKVRARVRQLAEIHADLETNEPQMGLVVIDYLQLLESEQKFRDRHLLIAHIAKSLKALAREFKCPVVALSQLNRNVEGRGPDARPNNSDLRESGAIEQDADIIIMVHRPETLETDAEKKAQLKGKAELIITKNRQGETGTVYCTFEGKFSRFISSDEKKAREGHAGAAPQGAPQQPAPAQ